MTRFSDEVLEHLGIDLPSEVSRRRFLKFIGGGIVVTVSANDLLALQQAPARRRFGRALPDDFNTFLRIGEDGRVSCFTGKIEMGQGVVTSLAQMLADELEVPLESVDMVMGDTDLCPWDMGTFGSMSTRFFGPPLRAAAAEARAVLLELAAEKLDVPQEQLIAADGVVSVVGDAELVVSYAELAKGQKIARRLDRKAVLESVENFTIVGKPHKRTDAISKVTGEARFSGDIRRDGMLYARMLRPPAHGATLTRVDSSGIEAVAGATMVVDRDLVAVLHPTPDGAERAIALVDAKWETPELDLDEDSIFDHLVKVAPPGETLERGGDLNAGMSGSVAEARHTYLDGYVAHAPIETHTAVAEIAEGKCTIWASTQTPFRLQTEVAEALDRQPPGDRGCAAGQTLGAAGAGGVVAGGGVLLRYLSTGRGRQDRRRIERKRTNFLLGLHDLFCGLAWSGTVLRYSAPPDHRCAWRMARGTGYPPLRHRCVAGARQQHQHLRPREPPRHPRGAGGDGPGRVPIAKPR